MRVPKDFIRKTVFSLKVKGLLLHILSYPNSKKWTKGGLHESFENNKKSTLIEFGMN